MKDGETDIRNNYQEMMRRDFRRWSRADQNNDGSLTKEEFTDFLHPEESKHMRDIIVDVGLNVSYPCMFIYILSAPIHAQILSGLSSLFLSFLCCNFQWYILKE